MTLRQQLLLAISILFLLVVSGLQILSLIDTKDFLEKQLASHAQDAATSLSHTMVESLASNDRVLASVQISSMFDRGYYRQIALYSPRGEKILNKEMPANIKEVPGWFTRMFVLETSPGEAFVISGWRQLGKLIVISQPAFAYQFLWENFKQVMFWMGAMYAIALAATTFLLRVILQPLNAIEHTANEIQLRKFTLIEAIPRARELRKVVVTMNAMSRKISAMLDEETAKAEHFRAAAYLDQVTGLNNRAGFDITLQNLLSEKRAFANAVLILLEIEGLKNFNQIRGFSSGDAMLSDVAAVISRHSEGVVAVSGRIGGSSFAFVLTELPWSSIDNALRAFGAKVAARLNLLAQDRSVFFNIGAVEFPYGRKRGEIFSKADLALETARSQGSNQFALLRLEEDDIHVEGSSGWRNLIQHALTENRWTLFGQAVLSLSGQNLFHREIFARLIDREGNFVSAQKFLPMALRHQLMAEVDRAVLTLAFRHSGSPDHHEEALAVNLSMQSVLADDFRDWLQSCLADSPKNTSRLSIELSERVCAQQIGQVRTFVELLRRRGVGFGIDQFGVGGDALKLLREMPPDYIKLDAGWMQTDRVDGEHGEYLRAIVKLAASMEIKVIAQNVESAATVSRLMLAGVQYGQGYLLGEPVEFV